MLLQSINNQKQIFKIAIKKYQIQIKLFRRNRQFIYKLENKVILIYILNF